MDRTSHFAKLIKLSLATIGFIIGGLCLVGSVIWMLLIVSVIGFVFYSTYKCPDVYDNNGSIMATNDDCSMRRAGKLNFN